MAVRDDLDETKSADELRRLNIGAVGFSSTTFRLSPPTKVEICGPFSLPRGCRLEIAVEELAGSGNTYLTITLHKEEQPNE